MSVSVEELANILGNMSLNNTATIQAAKEIANTLRTFSGNSDHLETFINSVDKFHNRYGITTDNSLNEFVFSVICSKIISEAGDYILCRPDLETWPDVRDALRLKFGDRTDRNVLHQQFLYLNRNKNENIIDFLDRLKIMKMKLNLKINADSTLTQSVKTSLIEQNEVTAVTILLSNVNSDLRTALMTIRPRNIDEATTLVINHTLMEQQIVHRNNSHHSNFNKTKTMSNIATNNHNHRSPHTQSIPWTNRTQYIPWPNQIVRYQNPVANNQNYSNMFYQPNQVRQPSFPSQPINIQTRKVPPPKYFTNTQVFGKQKSVFAPENSHKPTNDPEPMSTTYHNSMNTRNRNRMNGRLPFNNFQQTGPKNFHSEELYNVEPNDEFNYLSESHLDNYDPSQNDISYDNYYNDNSFQQYANYHIQQDDIPHLNNTIQPHFESSYNNDPSNDHNTLESRNFHLTGPPIVEQ